MNMQPKLQSLQQYFSTGVTRPYAFRKQQLKKLKASLYKYEEEIYTALYTDLKKSKEEVWITETGFVLNEISYALNNLSSWMEAESVGTNLLNFPSKSYTIAEPLGVVLIISPWNYPLQLLLTPLVGAIAAGNCVVVKPSEFAPATANIIKKIIIEIFEQQYVLYTEGDGSIVIPAMMEAIKFDHIFYTGSTVVGKKIYKLAAETLTAVTLELGGKSPCIVLEDANIAVAARRIVITKFSNAGQMCVAPDYVLVHTNKKEKLIAALIEAIIQFYGDDALQSYDYGKIINANQFNRLVSYFKDGTIMYGGNYNEAALYIQPSIVTDIDLQSAIMQDEIFGPILPIISFATFNEAKAIIDKNPNPLALYVFTSSSQQEKNWIENIAFGGGCINNASLHVTNHHLPFGGRGNSGIGAYHGKNTFATFSHKKAIMKTPTWLDPNMKYPSFKGKLNFFRKFIK